MPERTFDLDKFTVGDVDNHLDDIRNQFQGDPKVSQGSWVTGNKAVLDASDVYQHKGQAILHGLLRRQDAVYDIQRGKDINLPHRKRSQ